MLKNQERCRKNIFKTHSCINCIYFLAGFYPIYFMIWWRHNRTKKSKASNKQRLSREREKLDKTWKKRITDGTRNFKMSIFVWILNRVRKIERGRAKNKNKKINYIISSFEIIFTIIYKSFIIIKRWIKWKYNNNDSHH